MPGVMCRHWGLLASGKPVDMGVRGPRSDNVKSWSSLWHIEGIYPPRQTQWEQLSLTLNSIIITKFIFLQKQRETNLKPFILHVRRAENIINIFSGHGIKELTHLLLSLERSHSGRYHGMICNYTDNSFSNFRSKPKAAKTFKFISVIKGGLRKIKIQSRLLTKSNYLS